MATILKKITILSNKIAKIIITLLDSVSLCCKSYLSKTANIKILSANKHK